MKNADENELRSIASDPDSIHMYNVADFSFLLDIVDNLTENLCNSVKGPGVYGFKSKYANSSLAKGKGRSFLLPRHLIGCIKIASNRQLHIWPTMAPSKETAKLLKIIADLLFWKRKLYVRYSN